MIDLELRDALAKALKKAQKKGDLPKFDLPEEITVERPKQADKGDLASPMCMKLARLARMAPVKIAEAVVKHLKCPDFVGKVEVAHPGFINVRLDPAWLVGQVEAILEQGADYGNSDLGEGTRVQVEYVSANPTGPLHIGSARNAVLGDAIASVLDASGYDVSREYYVNDAGSRMLAFYRTLYARYAQALGLDEPVPEDGYHGPYMIDLGQDIAESHGREFLDMEDRASAEREIGLLGLESVRQGAKDDLAAMGVHQDVWFSEQSLYDNGQYEHIMSALRQGNHLDLADGAIWFKATALGGAKDEVVIRSDGTPGYFASDIAYHYNKFVERGFDWVIDVWGADHQGHVPRMMCMMEALDLDPQRLTLIIYQLVTLKRGGELVRLSKRTGDMITLREVVEEVGSDAVRYFLVSHSADSQMDFDIELAKEQSDENPVYYIQYAHARISSIVRRAEQLDLPESDLSLLKEEAELNLLRQMTRLAEVVRLSAEQLAPHHLAYYAYELAAAFHSFYRDCRVVSSDPADAPITAARLRLVEACRVVLAKVLRLMGMNAPETM